MFAAEVGFAYDKRKLGKKVAVEHSGDIHQHTVLYGPEDSAGVPYLNDHELFDFNEHFIELGSRVQGRSFDFMLLGVGVLMVLMPASFLVWMLVEVGGPKSPPIPVIIGLIALTTCMLFLFGFYWYTYLRAIFLTALTARYRFNRTTGKVYVLRPRQFGGNAVLDWRRVKAHPNWYAVRDLKPGFQYDPDLRAQRQSVAGGHFGHKGLVLYWPPLDPNGPERKGEDIIWVGQTLDGRPLWEYIRVFMQEGMDAVPAPGPDEYRRKGRFSMWQQLWEDELEPDVRMAKLKGNLNPLSAVALGRILMEVPFLPFNTLAQWLCYWPTFPKEWNSDCGQKRREKGIGPEEPLRWKAKA